MYYGQTTTFRSSKAVGYLNDAGESMLQIWTSSNLKIEMKHVAKLLANLEVTGGKKKSFRWIM